MSRITLTLSQALHTALKTRAQAEDRTRSGVVQAALKAYLEKRQKTPDLKTEDLKPEPTP